MAADNFTAVLGTRRGRALIDSDFAECQLSQDAQLALTALLEDIKHGRLKEALTLLGNHAAYCLCADISDRYPALAATRTAVAEHVAAETLINWREVTRDFEHLAGVRLYHASCLLQDEDGIVHIWPEGYQYATSSDAHRPVFACGFAADSRVQHAPRGAWKQPQGLNLCRECGRVPGSPTSRAEKKESRDYEPLPRNWERSLNSERTRYSLRSEIEDSMRRMLGDIASTDANRVSEWNEANIRAQANYIYSNALRRVTRKLVAADVRLVVLRALNHPRRLFCETLHARLIRLELAAATQMLEKSAEDLFDMWLPRAPAAWSKRARLTRCADAAAQVEKELRYYGPPSLSECWWPKIEPDMATPSSQPPYAHRTKARPRPHK